MKRLWFVLLAVLALVVAGGVGYLVARHLAPASAPPVAATPAGQKVLYWYDPMVPEQHFDRPGKSPFMDMQLLPKYADAGNTGDHDVVRVSPAAMQNLGMRTAPVKVAALAATVQVPGTVTWDPRLAVTVSARTSATLEKLYVRAPFTAVKAGQPLAEILAPQWRAAADEYFALADATSAEGRALRTVARARLHALGMDAATVRGLRASGGTITLRAPVDGVVSQLDVQEGQQVGEGAPIMRINGLGTVWIEAAIPQAQSAGIGAGTPITATVSALPGKIFHGEVQALLPEVDAATRSQRARIVLDNPGRALAPGMFAQVRIDGAVGAPQPLVPTDAIVAEGVDTRVIVVLDDGQFRPVRVRTGRSADGQTEILAGLQGGERIVTSGQFLLDSEASLSGALERLGADPGANSGTLEPRSTREAGGGEGPGQPQASGYLLTRKGTPLRSPKGEGKEPAMPGMTMPMPAATAAPAHDHGSQP